MNLINTFTFSSYRSSSQFLYLTLYHLHLLQNMHLNGIFSRTTGAFSGYASAIYAVRKCKLHTETSLTSDVSVKVFKEYLKKSINSLLSFLQHFTWIKYHKWALNHIIRWFILLLFHLM